MLLQLLITNKNVPLDINDVHYDGNDVITHV